MPRIARVVVPGVLHHVTQRGNNGQDVFLTDGDREFYLGLLRKRSGQYGLEVARVLPDDKPRPPARQAADG